VAQASRTYSAFVRDQTEQLVAETAAFVAAYRAGHDAQARSRYAPAREHWERIEPVAESFGDLDAKIDAREADVQSGQRWTGWHRLEKDLWPARAKGYTPLTRAERGRYADDLLANTKELSLRTRALSFTADQIGNGARELLDEVATRKVTGEEDYWSRTDLWDFQGNVDGARAGFEGLRPLLQSKDSALNEQIETKFAALQALLDTHKRGAGFRSYQELTPAQIKQLADAVNALAEPMSKLTAAVV